MLTFGITIVRHGETEWNKKGLLQGQAMNSSLSDIGMQQAEAAGKYLRDVKFTNVFVSDMARARQTCEAIVKHNSSCSGLEIVTDPSLKERCFGSAEGGLVVDMKNMAAAAGQSWLDFTPPGGETIEQMKTRVETFLGHLFQRMVADHCRPGQKVTKMPETEGALAGKPDDGTRDIPAHALVVSHGALIRVAMRYFVDELKCPLPQGLDMSHVIALCPNTGICRFIMSVEEVDASVTLSAIRCVFINRCEHI
ncbi:probable fructose-2,6-bisphosphatase TIGAR A isoform X2 [Esox lucius]|uniref:fructose-2,6-bisphosphate 2-phosphatase n=1 Tax=Esox lucius TaxID=8010 RepID=A0AAY5KWN4_ESOLU|nr:probable fructose-2,6-bisphosphatase TIGAR A isoform X2 [Esox lucius]